MKNKHIGSNLSNAIDIQKKDAAFTIEFERQLMINDISQAAHEMRINAGLTQSALAEKAHTTQQVIARLESGKDHRLPSCDLLSRLASALGKKLIVRFV